MRKLINRIKGHRLLYRGQLVCDGRPAPHQTQAVCECGDMSEPLPTTREREAWHRRHKIEKKGAA